MTDSTTPEQEKAKPILTPAPDCDILQSVEQIAAWRGITYGQARGQIEAGMIPVHKLPANPRSTPSNPRLWKMRAGWCEKLAHHGVKPTLTTARKGATATGKRAASRAADLAPTIFELQEGGATSLRAIADGLNASQIPTARGDGKWTAVQVSRVPSRVEA